MADLVRLCARRILVFDGGFGTSLARLVLKSGEFGGHPGCNEYLNVTRPDIVEQIHSGFLAAGADIVETNSFGAARHILAEHGLAAQCSQLNRRAAVLARRVADRFSTPKQPRFVAGSIGPGSKLPSLGQIGFAELVSSYLPQVKGLLSGRVDCLIVETSQDMLQAKAVLLAAQEAFRLAGCEVPVLVQFTLDRQGRTLTGSDPAAILATFEPLPVSCIGLNCGFGPRTLAEPARYLAAHCSKFVSLMPNAGLPKLRRGKLVYDLKPADFASQMRQLAVDSGLNIVGGCCGTTPEHIRLLAKALTGARPRRSKPYVPAASSLFRAQPLAVRPKPLICGERTNATGSRRFRKVVLARDFAGMTRLALNQEKEGAHVIDLSVAAAGSEERRDMAELCSKLNPALRLPVMVDSTDPATVQAALERLSGRSIVNSTNLADRGRALKTMALCRRYGAALVCMTIDERGMAMTVARKLAVARRLYRLATTEAGLAPESLFFDFLTFTLASGDRSLRRAAAETLAALKASRKALPGSFTLLGVSNVSHGLPATARRVLNSVFLQRAIRHGLDAAIVHAGRVIPLSGVPAQAVRLCDNLIYDRRVAGRDPLAALLEHFSNPELEATMVRHAVETPTTRLRRMVLAGEKDGIGPVLAELLRTCSALDVINGYLLPAMAEVGRLFEKGRMLLPFVLRSAEVMAAALETLQPHLEPGSMAQRSTLLIATVQGDIHDIGKNLVDAIVSANGYRVVNLGIDQTPAQVLAAVERHRPDAIGLSGLLVESARQMKNYLVVFREAGISLPVLCGGAALTRRFVRRELQPHYLGRVYYCRTAMDGLKAMQEIEGSPRLSAG